LPTGGGKTFTAERFLCMNIIPKGYKVLWLAHTHHLLDQAFHEFRNHAALAFGQKKELRVRMIAGAPGYAPVRTIETDDDILIGTLQTLSSAVRNQHQALYDWLYEAGEKPCVVFDEAHHAPARSYWQLLEELREVCPSLILLGLIATPLRTDEQTKPSRQGQPRKASALHIIFPQDVIHEVTAVDLMSQGILSQPIFEEVNTDVMPDQKLNLDELLNRYGDLTEKIVTLLAENQARNDMIVRHFVQNRDRYGKTIIFATRWAQCEYLASALRAQGVEEVYTVYSKVDGRNAAPRTASDNENALESFKKSKRGVLVNILIATEGSDFPDVQTVFITRQKPVRSYSHR
jgi:superfamily II DNA or RNA helicase